MADKKIIAVVGATGTQGGGLVRAILNDKSGSHRAGPSGRCTPVSVRTELKRGGGGCPSLTGSSHTTRSTILWAGQGD